MNRSAKAYLSALLFAALAAAFAVNVSAEVRSKKFSKAEIKNMAKTRAIIETKLGNIEIEFFPEKAPNHVDNFIGLARKGFYDGTAFHRVIPGFMVQGGDPNSKDPQNRGAHGAGGPGYSLKAEFNDTTHERGVLSMARSTNPDSAGSQFFIVVKTSPWLDGKYTVFGRVTKGMDAADKIVSQPRDKRDNPLERVEVKVRVIEPGK